MMDASNLVLPNKGITTFQGLKELARYAIKSIDLKGNSLDSFEQFGAQPELVELHLENNNIESMLGLTKQRSLQQLFLKGNPIAEHPHYRVMALLTVGFSLHAIDGKRIEPSERELARYMGPTAALAVSYGWIPDGVPHTAHEYEEIITKLRAERKWRLQEASRQPKENQVTILSVLEGATAVQQKEKASAIEAMSSATDQSAESADLQRKAVSHLAQRIANLEVELTAARKRIQQQDAELAAGGARRSSPPRRASVEGAAAESISDCIGLGRSDVMEVESLTFNPNCGVTLESTRRLSSTGSGNKVAADDGGRQAPVRCVVTIDSSVQFKTFFSRSLLLDIPSQTIQDVQCDVLRRIILIRSADNALHQLVCEDEDALIALFKTLYLRRNMEPPLPEGLSADALERVKTTFRERRQPVARDMIIPKAMSTAQTQTDVPPDAVAKKVVEPGPPAKPSTPTSAAPTPASSVVRTTSQTQSKNTTPVSTPQAASQPQTPTRTPTSATVPPSAAAVSSPSQPPSEPGRQQSSRRTSGPTPKKEEDSAPSTPSSTPAEPAVAPTQSVSSSLPAKKQPAQSEAAAPAASPHRPAAQPAAQTTPAASPSAAEHVAPAATDASAPAHHHQKPPPKASRATDDTASSRSTDSAIPRRARPKFDFVMSDSDDESD